MSAEPRELTDEELREKLRPKEPRPTELEIVLGEASLMLDAPCALRGETVGVAHYRVHADMGPGAAAVLERRIRDRLPCWMLVDVVPYGDDAQIVDDVL